MPLRNLGNSDLIVSAVGLGCNNFGRTGTATESQEVTNQVLNAAIDCGVAFLDCADIYGKEYGYSEKLMGEVVKARRGEIVLATKFGHIEYESPLENIGPGGSRAYIRAALQGSLERLQTDHIDLYYHHTPDPRVPVEETLEALNELIEEGRVTHIGHSNYSAEQAIHADTVAKRLGLKPFIASQNEYSLLERSVEKEILPTAREIGLGFIPWFPLYNGLLTGKFDRNGGPTKSRIMMIRKHLHENAPWDVLDAYSAFCDSRGITMLQATIGWLLDVPGLSSVIAGATSVEQVKANAAAVSDWRPSAEEFAEISELFSIG
jgi:aryl-alcohol dehydrogenase-like predicted oxidoreductase